RAHVQRELREYARTRGTTGRPGDRGQPVRPGGKPLRCSVAVQYLTRDVIPYREGQVDQRVAVPGQRLDVDVRIRRNEDRPSLGRLDRGRKPLARLRTAGIGPAFEA